MQSINLTDIFYVISLYYIFTIWGHLHWQQISFWMSHFSGAKRPHLVNISCLCECVCVCECVWECVSVCVWVSVWVSVWVCVCVSVCTHSLSRVWLFAIPWTLPGQAPLSTGFSRQESWSRVPFPFPGHLSDPGIKPAFPVSAAVAGGSFPPKLPGKH